ncbi:alpha/beta hydrolase [Lysinibacillus yapensis]|uniref:Alpha/beta hydrolase n=1 Tax=Ureibacillus yapensis TaxID=2304605 RepID=A0A396S8K8_9BACL|nr:alpha/beta hydrolase [Lysinibacillus yapensis]RHW37429.1 alpha/beta hydrolase [Lysinibacillus yapensis]
MPLHHYIEQYFKQHPERRFKGVSIEVPPLDKRPNVLKVDESTVKIHENQISIRIYTPDDEEEFYPLFVFFPGGHLISANLESYDVSCRLLCQLSGYKVVSVDYRLSSTQPAHAAFNDCYRATKWVVEHAEELGGRPDHIAVGGPSAGGHLATAVVIHSIKTGDFQLAKQVLHYPIVDLNEKIKGSEYQSRELYNAKYGVDLTKGQNELLCPGQNDENDSVFATDKEILAKSPETLIFTAEYDPFCDEGELYAEKLKEAGVKVKLVRFDGGIHGFMQNFPGSPDYMRGYDITSEFLLDEKE